LVKLSACLPSLNSGGVAYYIRTYHEEAARLALNGIEHAQESGGSKPEKAPWAAAHGRPVERNQLGSLRERGETRWPRWGWDFRRSTVLVAPLTSKSIGRLRVGCPPN
jgi:hypothetical protein